MTSVLELNVTWGSSDSTKPYTSECGDSESASALHVLFVMNHFAWRLIWWHLSVCLSITNKKVCLQ